MLKYAIAGNIASGKSTVEKILRSMGYKVFDTDKIAHEILDSSLEVLNAFKDYDILSDGKIDRTKLAKVVFNDESQLKKLESIIHPKVREEILKIFETDYEVVFISVPQLFEAGFEDLFDKIIYVTADESVRITRLMKRNNLTQDDALTRIKAQLPDALKIKQSDIIIENNGTLDELNALLNQTFPISK